MSGWKDTWKSLKAVVGMTTSAVAFGLAILGSMWDPGIQIRIGLIWLAVVILVVVAVLATAIKMAMDARRKTGSDLPRVVHVHVATAAEHVVGAPVVLVMGRSRQFGVNILVTVYYEERLEADEVKFLSVPSASVGSSTSRRTV